jgi:hypothetical protein
MTYNYNPTAPEMRDAYSVAYGDLGDLMIIGALYGHLKANKPQVIEKLYQETLDKIREDLKEKELI